LTRSALFLGLAAVAEAVLLLVRGSYSDFLIDEA
jgi:hypothetical protein